MGTIVVNKLQVLLPLTSVVHAGFLFNHLECRHFSIRYLHVLKQILAKCVVILISQLKLNDETLRIL